MLGIKAANEGALTKVLSADKKSWHLVPTWQDIEVLEAAQKALKHITDALSGEEYVTLSYVRPALGFSTSGQGSCLPGPAGPEPAHQEVAGQLLQAEHSYKHRTDTEGGN